jgi:hypothetical protein
MENFFSAAMEAMIKPDEICRQAQTACASKASRHLQRRM